MSKIAIDIALIPPDDIMDICVDLCQKHPDNSGNLGLNKTNNLPHISLFMGMVEQTQLEEFYKTTERIIKDAEPILTSITRTASITDKDKIHYYFEIKNTSKLFDLHKKLVENLKEYYPEKTNENIYFSKPDEKIDEKTFFWVDNYITGSSLEKFWPHITLKGCTNPIYTNTPKEFKIDRLAICHLGNHCTCQKILWETKLK